MKQLLYRITEPAGSIPDERKIFSNHALKLLILPLFRTAAGSAGRSFRYIYAFRRRSAESSS